MSEDHVIADEYVSGKMAPAARREADVHLSRCSTCKAAVEARLNEQARLFVGGSEGRRPEPTVKGEGADPGETGPVPKTEASAPEAEGIDALQPRLHQPGFEPVRILLPHFARKVWEVFSRIGRFGIVLGLTVAVLLLPSPEGISPEGHRALAVLVFTASVLALEPVSLPIAALMVPVVQVALGVANTTQGFEPFSRPVVFLILSSLFLAEALRKHGLTRRLALLTIIASGGEVRKLLLGLMGIAAVFSMWVENTATAAILIPVALTISRQVGDPKLARAFLVLLALGIAYAASLGGMATIMGAASNAVASGFLAEILPWRFMDWMRYGLPSLALIFPLTWWLLLRVVPVPLAHLDLEPVRKALNKQGRMGGNEWELLITAIVAIILWVGGESFEKRFALPPTLMSAAIVGVATVAYLAVRGILNWEDLRGVSWGIFLIIGAGLSLGDVLVRTGVTQWFAELIGPIVTGLPLVLSLLLLVLISALLTNLLNNTTIAAVFVPVLISLAKADPGFNAVQLVLPVALATTFGYSLPSASGRMALIAASGIVSRMEMLRYGVIMTLASSLVLAIFFYLLVVLGWI